ncbi:unnamed protein product [Caenorhabditis angaria]|uniref:Tyrosine-protein phosphatase domain-containing protein n=1 Tax=Caenorhabditis angaria TaxID=860376 RepID=A0A9P1IJ64_9PELO|nr:unnamed protein product [Caenorhabditis angaria]
MLQIFLIGSGFGYSMIGCSKKKTVAGPVKKEVEKTVKKEESVKQPEVKPEVKPEPPIVKNERPKKELSKKKEKEEAIKLYRNVKPTPIGPKAYKGFLQVFGERFRSTIPFQEEGKVFVNFDMEGHYGLQHPRFKAFDANPTRNRYKELKCMDSSRVVLENRKNDYINASWVVCDVDEYRGKNILTQGPLPNTISDFWAMIYQEKVEYIVMFCSFIENGVEQCAKYYPTNEGDEKYDNFEVKYVEKEKDPVEGVTWNVLHLFDKNSNESKPRRVNHIYVSWWAENTTPDDPKLTIELYKWLINKNESHIPMVFHCNNGIGRSATFASIYFILRIDIDYWTLGYHTEMSHVLLRNFRMFRHEAIESPLQSTFFYCCLLEYFFEEGKLKGSKQIDQFMSDYKKYAQEVRECLRTNKPIKIDIFKQHSMRTAKILKKEKTEKSEWS